MLWWLVLHGFDGFDGHFWFVLFLCFEASIRFHFSLVVPLLSSMKPSAFDD